MKRKFSLVLSGLVARSVVGRRASSRGRPHAASSGAAMACRFATALFFLAFVAACGASTESADVAESSSAASDLVEPIDSQDRATSDESTATPMAEPSPTARPTATAAPTATSVPTAAPIATPGVAATSAPRQTPALVAQLSRDGFAILWGYFSGVAADADPDRTVPLVLPIALPSTYEKLDLYSYPISEGVLLATSLDGDSIDGYVLLFDSDSPDALVSIVLLGVSIDEALVLESVLDAIYQNDPFVEPDLSMAFDGVGHGLELIRTGADPINDPLWILTAVPKNSSVGHDSLRRAAAQAARDSF